MYLAPLNYDRFFKKVFSEPDIAKGFLEDFLDIAIEAIEPFDKGKHITDGARYVEFDYHCRIAGKDIIVDMQQWYKQDVVQRFYTYHSLNTGLQLEKLPFKTIILDDETNKVKEIKDYRCINPVLTLIWMVEDTLRFDDNYVSYTMLPESVTHFLRNHEIWRQDNIIQLLEEREALLQKLNNTTKNLDFLPENRLIFLFQRNITKSISTERYIRWFRFAAKTANENNQETDFVEFDKDPVFIQIIKRLRRQALNDEEIKYITDQKEFFEKTKRFERGIYEDAISEEKYLRYLLSEENKKIIAAKDRALDAKDQEKKKNKKAIEAKDQALEAKDRALSIFKLYKKKKSISEIALEFQISETEVKQILDE